MAMGHIKEPFGINFIVDPAPLSSDDRKKISEIIAHYKATGKKPKFKKVIIEGRKKHMPKMIIKHAD